MFGDVVLLQQQRLGWVVLGLVDAGIFVMRFTCLLRVTPNLLVHHNVQAPRHHKVGERDEEERREVDDGGKSARHVPARKESYVSDLISHNL